MMAANEPVLGFGEWAARRLMELANDSSTNHLPALSDAEVAELLRQLWGSRDRFARAR